MDQLSNRNKQKPFFRRKYRRPANTSVGPINGIQRQVTPGRQILNTNTSVGPINGIQRQVTPGRQILNTDAAYLRTVELSGPVDRASIIIPKFNVLQGRKTDNCTATIIPRAKVFFTGQKTVDKAAIIIPKTKLALGQKPVDRFVIINPKLNVVPAGQNKDDRTDTNFPNNDDNTASLVDDEVNNEFVQDDFRNNNGYITNLQNWQRSNQDWQQSNHMINSRKSMMPYVYA